MKKTKRVVLGVDLDALSPPPQQALSEGLLGTESDAKITQAVEALVGILEQAIQNHIRQDMSKDPVQRSEAMVEASGRINAIRKSVTQAVVDCLTASHL